MQLAVLGLQSLSAILDSLSEFLPAASAKAENDRLFAAADVDLPPGSHASGGGGGGAASEAASNSSPKVSSPPGGGAGEEKSVSKRFDTQQQLKVSRTRATPRVVTMPVVRCACGVCMR